MGLETASSTTFKSTLEHFSEVIIGDENSSKFEPHIRLKKWGEESYLAFGVQNSKNIQATFDGTTVEWLDSDLNRKYRFYEQPKQDGQEYGGFEYEILLGRMPEEASIEFPCDVSNLNLEVQGPLSDWENSKGNIRPDNVLGSFAAYHKTKTGMYGVAGDADKYRTGKAFHIFRPFAVDAKGNKKWLDFLYDKEGSALRIIIDRDWFTNAAYPVLIDPTIGYSSLGASTDFTDKFANAFSVTAGTTGAANPGTAYYGGFMSAGTGTVYVSAYAFGAGNISGNAQVSGVSAGITLTTTPAFQSGAITWTGITSGTQYYIEGYSQTTGVRTRYDAGATDEYTNTNGGSATPPATHVARSGTQVAKVSVYVDYSAAGGGSPLRRNSILNGLGAAGPFFHNPLG